MGRESGIASTKPCNCPVVAGFGKRDRIFCLFSRMFSTNSNYAILKEQTFRIGVTTGSNGTIWSEILVYNGHRGSILSVVENNLTPGTHEFPLGWLLWMRSLSNSG